MPLRLNLQVGYWSKNAANSPTHTYTFTINSRFMYITIPKIKQSGYWSLSRLGTILLLVLGINTCLSASPMGKDPDLKVARIFTHQAVLQRDRPIPIWGTCKPKETVVVSINGQKKATNANAVGYWKTSFDAMPAGGPYTVMISTKKQQLVLNDVLIGEVFIASGQSNMEWRLKQTVNNYKKEIEEAKYPNIRYISITNNFAPSPQTDLLDTFALWKAVSPETAPEMSAVAYFFARSIHKDFKIPVGIISSEWGGTVAEAWTSQEALRTMGNDFDEKLNELNAKGKDIDAYKARSKAMIEQWIKAMRAADLASKPENGQYWTDAGYDPSKNPAWKQMKVPGKWENSGLPSFDGIVYFQTTFKIEALPTSPIVKLSLGPIDDIDSVWINGVKVAGGEGWDKPRTYAIPVSILKAGTNTIVVKVTDTGGDGGFTGEPADLYLSLGTKNISLAYEWNYRVATDNSKLPPKPENINTQNTPTVLFNAMINPIIPYAIKGVIWYQGESNATRALQYRKLFPTMIKDWRSRWAQGDFPFLYVQLANYRLETAKPVDSDWAELREAQTMTLALPNTGMACTIDIGEANDIHPRNKQDVGARLYQAAKRVVYGQSVVPAGPMYKSHEVKGNRVYINYENTEGKPLEVRDKYGYLKGFAVSDANNIWHWAKAEVVGQQVVVYAEDVNNPTAVRYAWANNPGELDLYNAAGLPAVPFRTDSLPSLTK